MQKNKRVILAWFLLISWTIIIFFFSSQIASDSSNLSGGVMGFVNNLLKLSLDMHTIRKIAHFSEYFILGILSLNVLSCYQKVSLKRNAEALLFCFLYACSDEIHQVFVPGRGPAIFDVLIDTLGSLVGIMFLYVFIRDKKKKTA